MLGLNAQWEVANDLLGSEHYPIYVRLNMKVEGNVVYKNRSRLYSKKTDWNCVVGEWERAIPYLYDLLEGEQDVEVVYSSFLAMISSPFEGVGSGGPRPFPKNFGCF